MGKPSAETVGNIREALSEDLRKRLEEIVNRYQHKKRPYYVLIFSEEGLDVGPAEGAPKRQEKVMEIDNKRVIRTRFMILDQEPPVILGTIVYKVDNRTGEIQRRVLPQDIPCPPEVLDGEEVVREIIQYTPIIGNLIN